MVRDTGIEPVTSSVSGKRSPAELIALGKKIWRWRRESNPCARLCRPLPHHSATPPWGFDATCTFERMTGFEPATPTLARLCATNCATSACHGRDRRPLRISTIVHGREAAQIPVSSCRIYCIQRKCPSMLIFSLVRLSAPGPVAQWKSVRFTRGRSLVRSQPGPQAKSAAQRVFLLARQ